MKVLEDAEFAMIKTKQCEITENILIIHVTHISFFQQLPTEK